MATTLEIVRGISQAIANSYDGAHDERLVDGEDLVKKIGLRREEGCPIKDSRVMDGFWVKMHGTDLYVYYHTEVTSRESHSTSLENELQDYLNNIVKYLKSEYKKVTGETLSLGAGGDVDVYKDFISRQRVSIMACQMFPINGMDDSTGAVKDPSDPDRLDKSVRDFLSMGREQAKKPSNYTAKNEQG